MGMRVRILVLTVGGVLAGARLLAADDASFRECRAIN